MSLARSIADAILHGFDRHFRIFRQSTERARRYFADADWAAARNNSSERISLYDQRVREAIDGLRQRFSLDQVNPELWQEVKFQYLGLLYRHNQPELAETFYNSVFVGLFAHHYYNNDNIFVRPSISTERIQGEHQTFRSYYPTQNGWRKTLRDILADIDVGLPFADIQRDIRNIVHALRQREFDLPYVSQHFQLQVLTPVFYRNKAAYVVGRVVNGSERRPFILPILHDSPGKVRVDALITSADDVANLFSFARTYFMVDCEVPSAVVRFLQSMLPAKSAADLYTAIGFHKQGKAEFYRDFLDHLQMSTDQFREAPGTRGMVMLVFTLPSYPYVFKVIRDRFAAPKEVTESEVIDKYRLIKRRDRVGRMADTWEFSHAAFPLDRFEDDLLEQLKREIGNKLSVEDGKLVIKHLFIERRLTPLNLYLQNAPPDAIVNVLREYGDSIREISSAGIFPGDLLLKNFGVTRHRRVIFYDYDEIVPLDQCRFRRIPEPKTPEQEMAAEPWYSVGPNDIFPEEFPVFLFPDIAMRKVFYRLHPHLLDADCWSDIQRDAAHDRAPDIYPYKERFGVESY